MWKRIFTLKILLCLILNNITGQDLNTYSIGDTVKAISYYDESVDYFKQHKFETAHEKIDSSLILYNIIYGPESLESVLALEQKGKIFYQNLSFDRTLKYWNLALDICRKEDPNNLKKLVNIKSNIAVVFRRTRKFKESEKIYLEVIKDQNKIYGVNSDQNAEIYGNLGNLYRSMGKFDKALESLNKAKDIYKLYYDEEAIEFWRIFTYIGSVKKDQGRYEEALENYMKTLKIQESHFAQSDLKITNTHELIGVTLLNLGRGLESIDYFHKVEKTRLDVLGENNPAIISAYINLGSAYGRVGNSSEQNINLKKALKCSLKILGENHIKTGKIYFNLAYSGLRYKKLHDVKNNLDKALDIYLNTFGHESYKVAVIYNELGNFFHLHKNYEKAIAFHTKSLKLKLDFFNEPHEEISFSYQNLGIIYWGMKEYDEALFNLQKAVRVHEDINTSDLPNCAKVLDNMASIYSVTGEYEKSNLFHHKALNIYKKNFPHGHSIMKSFLHNIAANHQRNSNIDSTLTYYHLAISQNISETSLNYDPYKSLANYYSEINVQDSCLYYYKQALSSIGYIENENHFSIEDSEKIISVLSSIGDFYLTNTNRYDLAKDYFNNSIDLIENQIKLAPNILGSKLINQYYDVYKKALVANVKNKNLNAYENFNLAESLRAFNLSSAIKNSDAIYFAEIPDSLTQQELDLKYKIADFDKKINEKINSGASETDSIVLQLRSENFNNNKIYDDFLLRLEQEYPKYFKLKYDLATVDVKDLQRKYLSSNQSLIEYLLVDSTIYTLLINKDTFILHENNTETPIHELVVNFNSGLTKYHLSRSMPLSMQSEMVDLYVESALKLYDYLIKPIQPHLNRKIIFVAEGMLGYLPFEVLLKSNPNKLNDFSNYDYLMNDYAVSYCYSATLLSELMSQKHKEKNLESVLAVAPFYEDIQEPILQLEKNNPAPNTRDTLTNLKYSGDEIENIVEIAKGKKLFGKNANLTTFKSLAPFYKILHLSTHAIANDDSGDYAYLAFKEANSDNLYEKLYIRDIYNMNLNSEMVVLSACNTSSGKLRKGEGIINMSRAFAYAGANSMVASHWSVDDKSTGELMQEFYKQLFTNKLSKDEALRQAKLKYIEQNKGLKAHPYYWAAFIGIGDMSPIRN